MTIYDREWKTVEVDEASAKNLADELDLPMPVAKVLAARGFERPENAKRFLNPRLSDLADPFSLPGMTDAVEHIWTAILKHRKITVYGDYDADGVTGTALLVSVLKEMGGDVGSFLPSRLSEGYGLTVDALDRCIKTNKPKLVITVDCGSSSVEAVEFARRAGVDVIVTDHHEVPEGGACPALAVVNPKLNGDGSMASLAGAGVVFKLSQGLVKHGLKKRRKEVADIDLRNWLDLVAIGTVADVVPLVGENRILVRHGLDRLKESASRDMDRGSGRNERPGLNALVRKAGIKSGIDCYHLGFLIAPRLNAAGRLGSAETALELLMTTDALRARNLAGHLDASNRERKRIEDTILDEAVNEIDGYFDEKRDFGLVIGREGWHAGTIGIVAARICARYRRPTVVIAFDEKGRGQGSCRSIEALSIVDVLGRCSDLLVSHGGHKMAAGLIIEKDKLDAFRSRFNELCAAELENCNLRPFWNIDAWINLGEADERLFQAIQKLRPFGVGNTTPTWGVRGVRLIGQPKIVGKDHLKMLVVSGGSQLEAIAFRMAHRELPDGAIDMLFNLHENTYMGHRSLQLNVKDFRPSEK